MNRAFVLSYFILLSLYSYIVYPCFCGLFRVKIAVFANGDRPLRVDTTGARIIMQTIDITALEASSRAEAILPPAVYGEDKQIASLVRRVRKLIKGAEVAPDAIIWRGCQIATMHHLDIFSGDIWIYPAYQNCPDDEWIVDVGIAAWRRAAQRQAKYTCVFTPLTAEQAQARIGADWTPDDVGVECKLYRLDVARECKALCLPYEPTITYGFWRKQARLKRDGKWISDQLAATETKPDKAQKRAEKKALRAAFTLDYPEERLLDAEQVHWRVAEEIARKAKTEEMSRALMVEREPRREEDGDLLFA